MSRPDPSLPIVSAPSSGDAWLALSDELLGSINHALNNRLAALGSLARLLESNDPGSDPLLAMLVQEVDRLEHTVGLLRLVPRDPGEEAEPTLLADLLPQVIALHRLQGRVREIGYDEAGAESIPPTLMVRSSLVRALLLFLAEAERVARAARVEALELRCHVDTEEVAVRIEIPRSADAPGEAGAAGGHDAGTATAIEALLIGSGGRFVREGEGSAEALELRLPTLAAARQRERDARDGVRPG